MKYELIVGLEIHVQAKTKSKMFSRVSADYWDKSPNTCIDPVSLGLPGALPVPNKRAIELCLIMSLGLDCKINKHSKFDRKNYFYPDLPKGYQISQYDLPIGYNGKLEFTIKNRKKTIGITRVHMEEDTGKSIHENGLTLLDFNKAGVPLIEIVTEPDFRDSDEVLAFADELRRIIRYLGVSDGDMEKGQIRYELNISLRKRGNTDLPDYKVEVKNIGSISILEKVLKFEVERQTKLLDQAERPIQETRGVIDASGQTKSQRVKENSDDYRYFPEPDIPPLYFEDDYIEKLRRNLSKLPEEIRSLLYDVGLNSEVVSILVGDKDKAIFITNLIDDGWKSKQIAAFAKLLTSDIPQLMGEKELKLADIDKKLSIVMTLIDLKDSQKVNSTAQSTILSEILLGKINSEKSLLDFIAENNLQINSDQDSLLKIVKAEIEKDSTARERFAKNPNVSMYFVGQVMKATNGSAEPALVKKLVEDQLS